MAGIRQDYERKTQKELKPIIPHEISTPNYNGNTIYCKKHNWQYYPGRGCIKCLREANDKDKLLIPHEAPIFDDDFMTDNTGQLEGMKFDEDKLRWDLLPIIPVEKIVEIITHGAKKYAPENWKKVDIQRFYAAGMRHLTAWKKGEEFDKDSGFTHLAHVGCNILFMMWIEENKVRHYPENSVDVCGKCEYNTDRGCKYTECKKVGKVDEM